MSEKMKILVVDDNEEFCQNVRDIVELRSYEVSIAYDGYQALEMVENNGFDVVLMDVRMPVMDGVTTFGKIKQIAPQIPVVMVTAYAMEQLVGEVLREGAFGFLKKPLDFERLFGIFENAVYKGTLVLVVDGERELCTSLEQALGCRGHKVVVASDEYEAIDSVWESAFDVVLVDTESTDVNRLDACQTIQDIRPEIVIIILNESGNDLNRPVKNVIEGRKFTCLEKPIDMEELVVLVEKITEKKAGEIV